MEQKAVSPVTGTVLMVAIVVVLSATVGVFVMGLNLSSDASPGASETTVRTTETADALRINPLSVETDDRIHVVEDGQTVTSIEDPRVGGAIVVTGFEQGDSVSILVESNGENRTLVTHEVRRNGGLQAGSEPHQVSSGGPSAVSYTVIESFEDRDMGEYPRGNYHDRLHFHNDSAHGSAAVFGDDFFASWTETSSLSDYPEPNETFSYQMHLNGSDGMVEVWWATLDLQSDRNLSVYYDRGEFGLRETDYTTGGGRSGSPITSTNGVSSPTDEWVTVRVTWVENPETVPAFGDEDHVTAELIDDGAVLATVESDVDEANPGTLGFFMSGTEPGLDNVSVISK
ncbi:type IV pilin [Halobium palmae]|uniref:Type IV pilin n=1 Tax=Halobium palmae TaxID=1776492 RepID=A0ABD5RVL7_9EURY